MTPRKCFNPYRVFRFAATKVSGHIVRRRYSSFNPYRVFRFAATLIRVKVLRLHTGVSIPIGFSGSLQLSTRCRGHGQSGGVSIPIGFSGSLQLHGSATGSGMHNLFQSLSGFQVRCNAFFVMALVQLVFVSIPIGFSGSLQQLQKSVSLTGWKCFNPYRVFRFAATLVLGRGDDIPAPFQSLSGFQVRCNFSL